MSFVSFVKIRRVVSHIFSYKLLTDQKGSADEIAKYIKSDGNPDEAKFFKMLKDQNADMKRRLQESMKLQKQTARDITVLKKQRLTDLALIRDLRKENTILKEALDGCDQDDSIILID